MKTASRPKLVWPIVIFFGLSNLAAFTLIPLWGLWYGYSGWSWFAFGALLMLNGMSVTVGYHRLWAHRTFSARWPVRLVAAIFGGMALQNSIYVWAARHRVHHRYVDDPKRDPHSIRTGFWHAHIGWMLRDWPTSAVDFSRVRDLRRDPIVMWQHRQYWKLVWISNLGIPLAVGWWIGDVIGMFLLAGVLRLVVSHHFTFFINSLAHCWGRRPYSEDETAVDNGALALLTWGEGYHNYHHTFQADYRNGVRWWQYDPAKWLINVLSWVGLVHDRKHIPWFRIQRARLAMEFNRLGRQAASGNVHPGWRERFDREYRSFRETVRQWQAIQIERVESGADVLRDHWQKTYVRTSVKELEYRLKMQHRRLRALASSILAA